MPTISDLSTDFLSWLCAQEMLGQVCIALIIKYSFTAGGHALSGGFKNEGLELQWFCVLHINVIILDIW